MKIYTVKMSKEVIERSSRPLRSKEEAILLLLYTIRMFDISDFLNDDRMEQVTISIDKMNRITYQLSDKMFSLHFPFSIVCDSEEKIVYSSVAGTTINSQVLSFLIEAFERLQGENSTFDTVFEIVMENEYSNEFFSTKQIWILISYLLKYDIGYLRYDYDPAHENGKIHPLHHFDIFLDSAASFKVGLEKKITFDEFLDVLDVSTECAFLRFN